MKKSFFILTYLVAFFAVSGQNAVKYPMKGNNVILIKTDKSEIESFKQIGKALARNQYKIENANETIGSIYAVKDEYRIYVVADEGTITITAQFTGAGYAFPWIYETGKLSKAYHLYEDLSKCLVGFSDITFETRQ